MTEPINRYDLYDCYDGDENPCGNSMGEDPQGEYVLYEDHLKELETARKEAYADGFEAGTTTL